MNNIEEYDLALMSEMVDKKCEPLKLYVEVINGNQIRYRALDSTNIEQEGIITEYDAYDKINCIF